jgi:hypothetical protein
MKAKSHNLPGVQGTVQAWWKTIVGYSVLWKDDGEYYSNQFMDTWQNGPQNLDSAKCITPYGLALLVVGYQPTDKWNDTLYDFRIQNKDQEKMEFLRLVYNNYKIQGYSNKSTRARQMIAIRKELGGGGWK